MKFYPDDSQLAKHVDHYWVVQNPNELFILKSPLQAYTGVTPEIIIPLNGYFLY